MSEGWPGDGVIRTPDRRLRVFVSSTLGELAAERRAVARAIAALRLTPVMFELGGAAALAASHQLGPLLEELRDPYLDAVSQLAMAWAATISGDIDGAIRQASASPEELRAQDEPYWTAVAVLTVGSHERAAGRYDDAQRDLSEAHALAERFGYAWLATFSQVQLGTLAVARDRLDEAGRCCMRG